MSTREHAVIGGCGARGFCHWGERRTRMYHSSLLFPPVAMPERRAQLASSHLNLFVESFVAYDNSHYGQDTDDLRLLDQLLMFAGAYYLFYSVDPSLK